MNILLSIWHILVGVGAAVIVRAILVQLGLWHRTKKEIIIVPMFREKDSDA
jgi:hypothetical protein